MLSLDLDLRLSVDDDGGGIEPIDGFALMEIGDFILLESLDKILYEGN